jgi:hypothetical protein
MNLELKTIKIVLDKKTMMVNPMISSLVSKLIIFLEYHILR